jgi:hypothetical protein
MASWYPSPCVEPGAHSSLCGCVLCWSSGSRGRALLHMRLFPGLGHALACPHCRPPTRGDIVPRCIRLCNSRLARVWMIKRLYMMRVCVWGRSPVERLGASPLEHGLGKIRMAYLPLFVATSVGGGLAYSNSGSTDFYPARFGSLVYTFILCVVFLWGIWRGEEGRGRGEGKGEGANPYADRSVTSLGSAWLRANSGICRHSTHAKTLKP